MKEANSRQKSLLDKLAQALETPSDFADNVDPKLASLLNLRWGKALPSEKPSPILEKYDPLENCTNLFSVKVNREAWLNLSLDKKQHNLCLANLQQTLEKVAIIFLQNTGYLLTSKDSDRANIDKYVASSVDALALLSHATEKISTLRRTPAQIIFIGIFIHFASQWKNYYQLDLSEHHRHEVQGSTHSTRKQCFKKRKQFQAQPIENWTN